MVRRMYTAVKEDMDWLQDRQFQPGQYANLLFAKRW